MASIELLYKGGALFSSSSTSKLFDCRLISNMAVTGAQVYNSGGTVELHDCHIETSNDKMATWQAGGVVVFCQNVSALLRVLPPIVL